MHDDKLGSITIGNLANGEIWSNTTSHQIIESDMPGPLTNVAWATGKRPDGRDVRSSNKSWDVALGIEGDLFVSKNPDVAFGDVGKSVNYTIIVKNRCGFKVKNITLEDLIYHPSVIRVAVPLNRTELLPGEVARGTVRYAVAQEDIMGPPINVPGYPLAKITNYANTIGYPPWSDPKDPYAQIVSGVVIKTIGVRYTTDHSLSKAASLTQGAMGDPVTFNITVRNTGDTLLSRSEITDLMPKGLSFISANPLITSQVNNGDGSTTLYWENLSQSFGKVLNPGESFEIRVVARFSGSNYGKLTNTVTSNVYNLRKEVKSATASVDVNALKQNINVVKTPDISRGSPDTVVNYTILVQNTGNISLKNVFASDLLPPGLSYVSSSTGGINRGLYINWSDIGPLPIGGAKQLWVAARIDGPVEKEKTLANSVYVEGRPEFGYNITNSTTASIVALEANITATKEAYPAFGSPGTVVTFKMNVTNNGVASLPSVFANDLLPAGLSYISSSPAGINQGQNVFWSDIGPMNSGERKELQVVAKIDGPISGSVNLTNSIQVSAKPEHGGNVTASARATVMAGEAKISVTKKAVPSSGSPGTIVAFTMNVTNSGAVTLPHVFATDLLPEGVSYVSSSPAGTSLGQNVSWSDIGPMESGRTRRLDVVARIDGPISGTKTLINQIGVSGEPENGENVSANASAEVLAKESKIGVVKTAVPASGSPGTHVAFSMNVTNGGAARLSHVSVTDQLPAEMSYVSSSPPGISQGQNVLWPDIGPMDSGQSKELLIVAHIDGPISGSQILTNKVNVTGKPEYGENVSASAAAIVQASEARISVAKAADPAFGSPGTAVTFTLDVTNSGDAALSHVNISDRLPAGMSYVSSSPPGTSQGQNVVWSDIGPMSSGESKKLEVVAKINGPISGSQTLTNQVLATGQPEHGEKVSANASADVLAREAKISVAKNADPAFGSPGTAVTFTLNVTNSGAARLPHVSVNDLLPDGLSYISSMPSGANQGQNVSWSDIGPMEPGESQNLQITARIDAPISGNRTLTNKVEAKGQPEHGDDVTAIASADVLAREAKIAVVKTAEPKSGSRGTTVTFTLDVTNSGAAKLEHVSVNDLLPAGMSYASSSPAGTSRGQNVLWPDIGPMASGETKRLKILAVISGELSGNQTLTNSVEATGQPEHGENITASATADVLANEARVTVAKAARPEFGSPGTPVTFTLDVTNSGAAKLKHVSVSDILPEGLSYLSSSPEGTNLGQNVLWPDIGPMAPGESRQFNISARIDGPISGEKTLTNKVDVTGKPEYGENVSASASAIVQASEAKITVAKAAEPKSGSPGTLATFTLEVKNDGAARLAQVIVSDTLPAGLSYVSSSPTGIGQGQKVLWPDIGPMISGETKKLMIVAQIDSSISGKKTLTNKVDVTGKPEYGENVTASAVADVEASEAKIAVSKTAEPAFGAPGTAVTFNLNVTNSGTAQLEHVSVSDILPAGMSYVSSSPPGTSQGQNVLWPDIGPMAAGENRQIKIIARISGPISGSQTLTNKVEVTGKPEYGAEVAANASADVLAREAKITVAKTAEPVYGSPGTSVTFTIDAANSGDALLSHVSVIDTLPAGVSYISSSPPGISQGQNVLWPDIGPMASGVNKQIEIVVRIDGPVSGKKTLTNKVDVTGTPEYGENVTASAVADVEANEAKISIAKSAEPKSGSPGTLVTFTLNVVNNGAAPLPHVTIRDLLPAGSSYVSSTPAGTVQGQNVIWPDIGAMAPGESRMLDIVARIDGPVSGSQTLTNQVEATGQPERGDNVTASASADVSAREAKIVVVKTAQPERGTIGSIVTFALNITNNGEALLSPVFVSDLLPVGLEYRDSEGGSNNDRYINWTDIGPLEAGATKSLWVKARIDGTAYGALVNRVDVIGSPEHGEDIQSSAVATIDALSSLIHVTKVASETEGLPGSTVNYTLAISNTGATEICGISAEDQLPLGLEYLGDDHGGELNGENRVVWEDLGCLKPAEEIQIQLMASIDGKAFGELNNTFVAEGSPVGSDEKVRSEAYAKINASPSPFIITKTSDKSAYRPGEEMTYKITVCNPLQFVPLEDVVVKDVFDNRLVRIVSSYPQASSDGQWYFASIPAKSCAEITVVAVYPQSNLSYDQTQRISGKGFVNVHNDLSTGLASITVTNCVYATARVGGQSWSRDSCVTVEIGEVGTKLQIREHGSGEFRTNESTSLLSENRSIMSQKSVSARYSPVSFQLPGNRTLNYSSKWAEDTQGKNYVTGSSMHETYRHATSIDRETYIKMDENGSEMRVDSAFNGTASIGFVKKPLDENGAGNGPIFEAQEDYSGQFRLNESFREYGSNAATEKAASGEGYVSSDRRLGHSQRSYEYGSGSYSSEEMVDTYSNYMAKDIELAYKPQNLSNPSVAGQNLKWSEGMWSKSGRTRGGEIVADRDTSGGIISDSCPTDNGTAPASIISESYSSLDYLKKDTVSLGLSEMKSNATFKGIADYKAKAVGSNGSEILDSEDRYVGEFTTSRKISLSGVSRYDQPHISVEKEGQVRSEWIDRKNSTVAEYNISITNDGNRALAPVYVRDIFPPGTNFVSASLMPAAISATEANWTVLHLGVGDTLKISLLLNVTENAPGNLLNRVEVGAFAGSEYITASGYSSIEFDWNSCCMPTMALEKQAQIDPSDSSLVHYTIILKNNARAPMAARLDDDLPGGMSLVRADPEPESYDGEFVHWVISDIKPDQVKIIEYAARAAGNGDYINNVHLDASAADGSGSYTADATSYVDLSETGRAGKTTRYDGWQPPDWGMNTSEGISI